MAAAREYPADFVASTGLTSAEEEVARSVVAGFRTRLDWMLRLPDWAGLFAAGVEALGLPGQRQGIAREAALLALPLERKQALLRWAVENFRSHLRSAVARRICRWWHLERPDELELEEMLTARQWQRMRREWLLRLTHEHRRYKHAQQLLFTAFQHLIGPVVAQIVYRPQHRADCAQEGALGLLAAIDRVDETGQNFAAYGTWWIRRSVRNFLLRQRLPVSAPINLVSEAAAADRSAADGESASRLQALLQECLRHPAVALDEPGVNGGPGVAETIPDADAPCPAESAERADACDVVARLLTELTAKQRAVLVQRFGLDGGGVRTLSAIARDAGISHQQAGMRERRALQRLEHAVSPLVAELHGSH